MSLNVGVGTDVPGVKIETAKLAEQSPTSPFERPSTLVLKRTREKSDKNESIAAKQQNRNSVDCSTITDVSASNVPEVEIVSLVEESIPRYRLTQDYLTQFGGTENADWVISTTGLFC